MKRTLLAAGAAALALSLPATAALADGYNARPAYMQAKPKPKAHVKPAAKPHKQARHKPRPHHHAPKAHGYAAAHVQYEEFESYERSVTHEVNGRVDGPYTSYSERYVAPHRGCLPQAPCGYSTGGHHGASYGHGAHHGSMHGAHHGAHHGSMLGYGGYSGAYGASSPGYGAGTLQPGFHYGPLTGGVGHGVDGGPAYGATTVIVRPHGYGYGRSSSSSSSSAYSSSQAYSSGGHDAPFGYGPTYGHGGNGYLGFKPGAYGYGVGQSGYGGFKR